MPGLDVVGDWLRDAFTNGGTASAAPLPPSAAPPAAPPAAGGIAAPVQAGQLPYIDASGGGAHDLRRTLIGAALALIPPLFAHKGYQRRQAGQAWSALGEPLMASGLSNMLGGREDAQAAQRAGILTGMANRGDVTMTPPTTGAPPVGNMAGLPVYQPQHLEEKFPQIFHPAAGGLPPSTGMQVLGGMNATPAMIAATIKASSDQDALQRQAASLATITGGQLGGTGSPGDTESSVTYRVGKGGGIEAVRTIKPKPTHYGSFQEQIYNKLDAEGKQAIEDKFKYGRPQNPSNIDKDENLWAQTVEDKTGHPPTNPERLAYRQWHATLGSNQTANLLIRNQNAQQYQTNIQETGKELNSITPMVPQQFLPMVQDFNSDAWERAVADPATKAAIDAAASPMFKASHPKVPLSDFISSSRATIQSNMGLRQQVWDAFGGAAPPGPPVTTPPSVAPTGPPRVSTPGGALNLIFKGR